MTNRIKDKNKSIFVKFHDDVSDKEVCKLMSSIGVNGTRVSTLLKRWAIEVPFWKEDFYCEKFLNNALVETIHESFDRKRTAWSKADEHQEESDVD